MWDEFFFYGSNELHKECQGDLNELLMQPSRSLFYARQLSAGVGDYLNSPSGIHVQILLRFAIANAVSYRNLFVTNGEKGSKDRRIAVSQNSIGFQSNSGELTINVLYFLYADYQNPRIENFSMGVL